MAQAQVQPEAIEIFIGAMPGGMIKPLQVPEGTTYEQAFTLAGISTDSREVKTGSNQTVDDLEAEVTAGERIIAFGNVRGN